MATEWLDDAFGPDKRTRCCMTPAPWVVEADSGPKVRLIRATHDEAWQLATSIADSVRAQGVAAVTALT